MASTKLLLEKEDGVNFCQIRLRDSPRPPSSVEPAWNEKRKDLAAPPLSLWALLAHPAPPTAHVKRSSASCRSTGSPESVAATRKGRIQQCRRGRRTRPEMSCRSSSSSSLSPSFSVCASDAARLRQARGAATTAPSPLPAQEIAMARRSSASLAAAASHPRPATRRQPQGSCATTMRTPRSAGRSAQCGMTARTSGCPWFR